MQIGIRDCRVILLSFQIIKILFRDKYKTNNTKIIRRKRNEVDNIYNTTKYK